MSAPSLVNLNDDPREASLSSVSLVCNFNPWIVFPVFFFAAAVISVALVFAFMPNDPSQSDLPFDGGSEFMAMSLGSSGSLYFSAAQLTFSPAGSAYLFSSEPPRLPTPMTVNATLDASFALNSTSFPYNWTIVFLLKDSVLDVAWMANDSLVVSILIDEQVNSWIDHPRTAKALGRGISSTGTLSYKTAKTTFYYIAVSLLPSSEEPVSGHLSYAFSFHPYNIAHAKSNCTNALSCNFTLPTGSQSFVLAVMDSIEQPYTVSLYVPHRWRFVVGLFGGILALLLLLLGAFIAYALIRRKANYERIP